MPLTNRVQTEFKVPTVSYGLSFSPLIYCASAKHAGHNSVVKKQGSINYSMDRENEVSKIFIISLRFIEHTGKETTCS